MRTSTFGLWMAGLAIAATLAPRAGAQTGGGYDLRWNSLDGGAATSTAGAYALRGTIGQPETGNLAGGSYALRGGFWNGATVPTDAPPDVTDGTEPIVFRLHGNAPNPFSKVTAIAFSLPKSERVALRVYDLAGRIVRTVLDRDLGPGRHQVMWDGRSDRGLRAAHGIYLLRLTAGPLEARRKLALVP